jgi:hypothetical protein
MNTQHNNFGAFALVIASGFSFYECQLLFLCDKCKMSRADEEGPPIFQFDQNQAIPS